MLIITFQDILNKKNAIINDLQYELARVCKAHDDLLDTYEEKLHEYGIPKIELGFIPLRTVPEGQGGLPKGPAGLVTKNRWNGTILEKLFLIIYDNIQFEKIWMSLCCEGK